MVMLAFCGCSPVSDCALTVPPVHPEFAMTE
jgi:hypothetical protein